MKVTVITLADEIFVLDVSEDLELENFKAFCEVESGFPAPEIMIAHNGMPLLDDKKSLKVLGIRDGDVVILQHMLNSSSNTSVLSSNSGLQTLDFSGIQVPTSSSSLTFQGSGANATSSRTSLEQDPKIIRDMFLANPDQLALLKQNNPRLADAFLTGNLDEFATVLKEQVEAKADRERQRIRMMNAHPFDTEAQRLIAEEIRQKNIEANMEAAMEFNPESFGTVVMLYINCRVNGFPVKAFIDSGAQTTIMSAACAERCHIMRLVDTRWAGVAKGVGVQKIIGRIHMVQIQIENDYLTTSFSVLEQQPMDMLLGLDMLKRHQASCKGHFNIVLQCEISLKKNVLHIGTTGTETPFLSERDLPDCARLSVQSEDELMNQSVREAEERDLARALQQSSRDSSGPSRSSIPRDPHNIVLPTDRFSDSDVKELVSLGFTREQVIAELRRFKGDKTQATAALFAKSLKF
uniref:DNA damage-inducible protein 1 n=2 Tax=Timema TaxID=61471 RepID=A0A7R9D4U7_TIMPO|nr:unnamed protein product [Timema douglasi]CAD7408073.1 unnamed protein product [Timema poppensis]